MFETCTRTICVAYRILPGVNSICKMDFTVDDIFFWRRMFWCTCIFERQLFLSSPSACRTNGASKNRDCPDEMEAFSFVTLLLLGYYLVVWICFFSILWPIFWPIFDQFFDEFFWPIFWPIFWRSFLTKFLTNSLSFNHCEL